jgi:hypothetical protein
MAEVLAPFFAVPVANGLGTIASDDLLITYLPDKMLGV